MESMKIITVCGAGVGTSTLLRMNISKAFDSFKLPLDVTVENKGLSVAKGLHCDAVFTFSSFYDELKDAYDEVIVINNLMDMNELTKKVKELLIKKGYLEGE
ncbi:MAG: PTS sugar transporter subunit IIB [Erysipelotrichaceae bacterium]|nr:PTS sugar transporter subunit IIB [Erysipelotrichaceae bacterium]